GDTAGAGRYRWAMLVTASPILIFALAGLPAAAIVGPAFLVPVTYLLSLYVANLWAAEPVPVLAALFLSTGILAAGISLAFFTFVFDRQFVALISGPAQTGVGSMPVGALLVFALLLPLVAEVAKNIGPVWLAR